MQRARRGSRRSGAFAALGVIALLLAAGCSSGDGAAAATERPASWGTPLTLPWSDGELTAPTTTAATTTAPPTTATTVPPTTEPPVTAPPTTDAPRPAGVVVTHIVDGDTLDVSGDQRIRLIGIDTPERGQCGFGEAAAALAAMVDGREVLLVSGARDDTDRYGRLLRYIEVDGIDVNLAMIESGWARSRYDSRDGYGRHTREDAYVAADVGSPEPPSCAAAPPAPPTTTAPQPLVGGGGGSVGPRFGTCKEAKANGDGPYIRGVHPEYDWYRDADSDGQVCE